MHMKRLLLLPLAALLLWAPLAYAQAVGSVTILSGVLVAQGRGRREPGARRELAGAREGDTLSTQRNTYALVWSSRTTPRCCCSPGPRWS